jgi:N-acetylneuraminate synthase
MIIDGKEIKGGLPPYIIAEASCNHGGLLDNAISLIEAARYAGADAVKFQAYTPDTLTLDCHKPDFIIQDGLWKGRNLYDLYTKAHTPFEWFPKLFKHAKKVGITIFASVFDRSSVDMLRKLDCPAYKIASMEIVDIPLIKYAAMSNRPMIISTGMATLQDMEEANKACEETNVAFLHCTSEYPGTVEWADLARMLVMKVLLGGADSLVGVSDHTSSPAIIPIAATALGAAIVEKHLMLENVDTEDREFSLTPQDFRVMVNATKMTHEAVRLRDFASNPSRQLKRSLYAVADIKKGEAFSEDNIRSIRPGYGLSPKHLPRLLGKKADQNYRKGDRIT